jgi:hypothetical protein
MDGLFNAKVDCKSPEGTTRNRRTRSDRAATCRFLLKTGSAELAWNEPGHDLSGSDCTTTPASSAERAVEGDLLRGTLENREFLIVQSRDE